MFIVVNVARRKIEARFDFIKLHVKICSARRRNSIPQIDARSIIVNSFGELFTVKNKNIILRAIEIEYFDIFLFILSYSLFSLNCCVEPGTLPQR